MVEEEGQEGAKAKKVLLRRIREAQVEQQKRELLKRFLTPEAYERISNVRMSNYELYNKLVELVVAMAQGNRIVSRISDEQLRTILSKLTSRSEPSLEIKHK